MNYSPKCVEAKKNQTKLIKNLVLYIAAFFMFVSCSKKDITPDPVATIPDIYVAGLESNGTRTIAKIWKNGVATSLTDGTESAGAISVYVSGTYVYAAGDVLKNGKQVPTIWKNGVATALSDGTFRAYLTSMFVLGIDVYVTGNVNKGGNFIATVWKNGTATSLTDGTSFAEATSVFVSGSDVYVGGSEATSTARVPRIWKNGVPISLPMITIFAGLTQFLFQEAMYMLQERRMKMDGQKPGCGKTAYLHL